MQERSPTGTEHAPHAANRWPRASPGHPAQAATPRFLRWSRSARPDRARCTRGARLSDVTPPRGATAEQGLQTPTAGTARSSRGKDSDRTAVWSDRPGLLPHRPQRAEQLGRRPKGDAGPPPRPAQPPLEDLETERLRAPHGPKIHDQLARRRQATDTLSRHLTRRGPIDRPREHENRPLALDPDMHAQPTTHPRAGHTARAACASLPPRVTPCKAGTTPFRARDPAAAAALAIPRPRSVDPSGSLGAQAAKKVADSRHRDSLRLPQAGSGPALGAASRAPRGRPRSRPGPLGGRCAALARSMRKGFAEVTPAWRPCPRAPKEPCRSLSAVSAGAGRSARAVSACTASRFGTGARSIGPSATCSTAPAARLG